MLILDVGKADAVFYTEKENERVCESGSPVQEKSKSQTQLPSILNASLNPESEMAHAGDDPSHAGIVRPADLLCLAGKMPDHVCLTGHMKCLRFAPSLSFVCNLCRNPAFCRVGIRAHLFASSHSHLSLPLCSSIFGILHALSLAPAIINARLHQRLRSAHSTWTRTRNPRFQQILL